MVVQALHLMIDNHTETGQLTPKRRRTIRAEVDHGVKPRLFCCLNVLGPVVQKQHSSCIAAESGNEDTMRLLRKVVDIDDPDTGTVRLKPKVEIADSMALDTRSTKTVRVKKEGS